MEEAVTMWPRIILILSLSAATVAVADEPIAVPVAGEPFAGELLAADSGESFTFRTKDGTRELPADALVRWGACAEPDRAPVFLLRDGTLLVAGILEATEKELTLDSDTLGLVRLPREQLAALILRLPAARIDRDRLLDEAARNNEDTARVILLNGDRMRGELVALDDRKATLRNPVGTIDLETNRISSLSFPSAGGDRAPRCRVVGLTDGSRLCVKQLAINEQNATLVLAGGLTCKADLSAVVFLQPVSPRILYLSDMSPTGYRHVHYLNRSWPYQADRNVLGGLMRCAGQLHLKGLGMHTAARISYVPPKGAAQFQAALGVDDGTQGMGSVRFRVFVDGKEAYVSPTVRGLDPPIPISVDVRKVQRLDLVVDFADRADVQDHANWLDARFVLEE